MARYAALVGACCSGDAVLETEVANYQRFRTFAGRLDMPSIFLNQNSEAEFMDSWAWLIARGGAVVAALGTPAIRYSIPFPGPATADMMKRVNDGGWDSIYTSIFDAIGKAVPKTTQIVIRLPWEFNLDPAFQNQSAVRDPSTFLRAFRRMAALARLVLAYRIGTVKIEWCPNVGTEKLDPTKVWPGQHFVDIIAQDIYFQSAWDPATGIFGWRRDQPHGLKWAADFAKDKAKLFAVSEAGADADSMALPFGQLGTWLGTIPHLHSHTIYDRNDGPIAGAVSDGSRPAVAQAYLTNWGLA